jgi:site-specific DNA-methyltransferase (adenine-specific)
MDEKQTTASRICSVCGGMITPNNTDSTTHERTISQPDELQPSNHATSDGSILNGLKKNEREAARNTIASKGRWPSNLIHDGSEEVVAAFPDSDGQQGAVTGSEPSAKTATVWGSMHRVPGDSREPRNDSGSAARFFYSAKADADDRIGSKHPTVKPVDLMQYLVRLITPPHGTVIDPFAGTGTTGEAAWREGMHAVLIEAEPEYQNDIRRRMKLCMAGPDERLRESIKAKNLPYDPGPLFGSPGLKGEGRQIYGKYADQNPRTDAWDEMWAKPFDFSAEPKGNPG